MGKHIGIVSACAHRLYLYRPELFDMLKAEGYEITVFGPEEQKAGEDGLSKHGITYFSLPVGRRRMNVGEEKQARDFIVSAVRERNIGILYSYGIRFAPLVNLSASRAGVPCMNVINGAGSLFITDGIKGDIKRMIVFPYIRYALKYSSRTVFQNTDDRDMFLRLKLVKENQTLLVSGSGVNTERFPESPLPRENIFGFLSRINPEKGIGEMLLAFTGVLEKYPDAKLRMAGELDGIENTDAMKLLDSLSARGSVEYIGETDKVAEFLGSCRYFVFPSYREGTPRATLEAMSSGRPVITTDAVGCRETVEEGVNGVLVKVRDVETLKNAMLDFCGGRYDAEKMGHNSRLIAEEKFNVYSVNRILIDEINRNYGKTR